MKFNDSRIQKVLSDKFFKIRREIWDTNLVYSDDYVLSTEDKTSDDWYIVKNYVDPKFIGETFNL